MTKQTEALAEHPARPATYTCGVCGVSMQMEQPAQQCKYGNKPLSCTSNPMDCQCALDAVFEQPAQRKPLTNEEITKCWGQVEGTRHGYVAFARAIEAKHGITGEQK